MKTYIIDCSGIADPEAFHDTLVETLTLPKWYGTNLDALYDCLTSITEETKIVLKNFEALDAMCPGFRAVFQDTQQANSRVRIEFS